MGGNRLSVSGDEQSIHHVLFFFRLWWIDPIGDDLQWRTGVEYNEHSASIRCQAEFCQSHAGRPRLTT